MHIFKALKERKIIKQHLINEKKTFILKKNLLSTHNGMNWHPHQSLYKRFKIWIIFQQYIKGEIKKLYPKKHNIPTINQLKQPASASVLVIICVLQLGLKFKIKFYKGMKK